LPAEVPFLPIGLPGKSMHLSRFLMPIQSAIRNGILGHQFKKRLECLLHAIDNSFYWRILKKTSLFSGFKNPYKNPIAFCRTEKLR
jgi:hypothetical protein